MCWVFAGGMGSRNGSLNPKILTALMPRENRVMAFKAPPVTRACLESEVGLTEQLGDHVL